MIRNGGGQPHQLVEQSDKVGTRNPFSFAPDGRRLSYYELSNETGTDIYTVAVDLTDPENPKPGRPEPFQHSQFNENAAAFSPDGRWIAYAPDVSGFSADLCSAVSWSRREVADLQHGRALRNLVARRQAVFL